MVTEVLGDLTLPQTPHTLTLHAHCHSQIASNASSHTHTHSHTRFNPSSPRPSLTTSRHLPISPSNPLSPPPLFSLPGGQKQLSFEQFYALLSKLDELVEDTDEGGDTLLHPMTHYNTL